jgi:hypothetical protein
MLDLSYLITIEATNDPEFFSFYSDELEGFTGVGHSIEDCLYRYRARHGMREHVQTMREQKMKVPKANKNPRVTILNTPRRKSA